MSIDMTEGSETGVGHADSPRRGRQATAPRHRTQRRPSIDCPFSTSRGSGAPILVAHWVAPGSVSPDYA